VAFAGLDADGGLVGSTRTRSPNGSYAYRARRRAVLVT
jgi:hypothetical protein